MSGGAFVTEFKRQFEGAKVSDGLEVASEDNSSGGFCLKAATDLLPNESLLSLPFESLLHSSNASNRSSFQRTFEEVMRLLRETDDPGVFEIGRGNQQQNLLEDQDILILILFLIHERAQGEQSPWHSYIKMLPQKISSPLALDPESESDRTTLDLLEGSNLLDLIYALQFSLHNIHDTLVAQVPSVASLAFEDFLWAFLIVNSRAFRLVSPIKQDQSRSSTSSSSEEEDQDENTKESKGPEMMTCLIPIADMANHVVFPDQVNFSHSSQFSMTSSSSPSVEFRTTRAVEKGQELRFSYNQLANWQLLVYYGFAVASNPVDGLSITLDSPEEENYETEIKKMLFMSCLEEFSNDHCIPRPNLSDSFSAFDARSVFPSPLIGTLRLLLMDDDEIGEFTVSNINSVLERAVSDRNEKAVFETLQSIISSMIDLFPTSLDHDLALLPTLSPSDPRFFLTIYLIDQKQILRDVLRAVLSVLSLEQ